MIKFIDQRSADAPRRPGSASRSRRWPSSPATRWVAAAVVAFGFGLGLAPQIVQAQPAHATAVPAPPDSVPAETTEVTVVTPALCAAEIVVDEDNPSPSTTLPGSCLISAAHGEFPEVAGAGGEAPSDLPATGSSAGTAATVAASVLAAGAALWFVARRPRAS